MILIGFDECVVNACGLVCGVQWMVAKLLLSRHPCVNPLHYRNYGYVPLSVLYQHRFGSLHIWSTYGAMSLSSGDDRRYSWYTTFLADFIEYTGNVEKE